MESLRQRLAVTTPIRRPFALSAFVLAFVIELVVLFGWLFVLIGSVPTLSAGAALWLTAIADVTLSVILSTVAMYAWNRAKAKWLFWLTYILCICVVVAITAHVLSAFSTL